MHFLDGIKTVQRFSLWYLLIAKKKKKLNYLSGSQDSVLEQITDRYGFDRGGEFSFVGSRSKLAKSR